MPLPDRDALAAYLHLRQHLTALHHEAIRRLPKSAFKAAAKKLGADRVRAADADTINVVVVDYAIYHFSDRGETLFERYFTEHPPAPGSHDDLLRQMIANHRYVVMQVLQTEPGVGIEAYDMYARQRLTVLDRGLGTSAGRHMIVAGELLWNARDDTYMTTGAMLPVPPDAIDRYEQEATRRLGDLDAVDWDALGPRQAATFAACVIRAILRAGGAAEIAYR